MKDETSPERQEGESEPMNRRIRAAAGAAAPTPRPPGPNDEINTAIRKATGHAPVNPPPTPQPEITSDQALRAQLATDAGLALEWGERLRGDAPAQLAADAQAISRVVAQAQAGPAPGGFDGGARGGPAPRPPSVESLLRASIEAKRQAIVDRALVLDHAHHYRNRYRRGGDT